MSYVSIITPVYDETKIMPLYESLLNQTNNQSFEWVVVTDKRFISYLPFNSSEYRMTIKIVDLNDNYGPSVARNVGFMVSDGDIIAYADADDVVSEDRVANLLSIYDSNKQLELCFNSYRILQEGQEFIYNPDNNVLRQLEKGNGSIPLGVSHTRALFIAAGMFQRGIVCGEDGILWRRMSNLLIHPQAAVSQVVAGTYKVNPVGQSRTQRRFDKGGFAFDAGNEYGSHGQYLDKNWLSTYNSVELFDK